LSIDCCSCAHKSSGLLRRPPGDSSIAGVAFSITFAMAHVPSLLGDMT